ncbi:hypothetical protein ARMSODRAFT_984034 [Armillaria solidipes]|uniref:FAD dependent oxidoreductase domain-containing protein n=1 Tax=Armillaria solidipes TaxID=1076256 RepID=A0A2H3AK89_9AGAR|nr:hypothetical protein ARMSODRAFT_984046 [Armillaria solidipes]PBK58206.1 hypothetical protein ARMSODRAFT_984034 [Armillaria solidipes]
MSGLWARPFLIGTLCRITGTVFARTLLDTDRSLEVVMLEVRDACSGATARNEGHITPLLYHDCLDLKKKHDMEAAKQIIKWFDGAKEKLGRCLEELPSETDGWGTMDGPAGMQLADGVCGVISTMGGAVHPYRPVTGILSRLLKTRTRYSGCTHTRLVSPSTPRGDIHTKHIIHATNRWTSHLLALMRERIVAMRGSIAVQRAGTCLDDGWPGKVSFVLYPGTSEDRWDYLT